MGVTLILACAGKGERAQLGYNKILFRCNDKTTAFDTKDDGSDLVFMRSLNAFIDSKLVDNYVLAVSQCDYDYIKSIVPAFVKVVLGGATRTESIKNALEHVFDDIVLIHDGARPYVDKQTIINCIESAKKYGSGIAAVATEDTVCAAEDEFITAYKGKSGLYRLQTPQGFKTDLIKKAYDLAKDKVFNDDGEVFKEYIGQPHLSKGNSNNIKLTFAEDFKKTEPIRTGIGFDCHKLVLNRKLILGGVEIPFSKGLLGHSDADVLAHAVMDAVLSALSLRDIGYHFPDTDEKYKNANSMELMKKVIEMAKQVGYKINSVSATILAEKPKLSPYITAITENLAKTIGISESMVGIGATTLEGLGFVGREEGICAQATAVLTKIHL